MVGKSKPQLNQSVIDGITTLQELTLSSTPVGCRELARRLHMEPTRVNRLLLTLEHIGLARKTAKRKYTTGGGMHVLAAQSIFASGLINQALGPLKTLRKFGHIVALGMLWRDHVSYLYHALPGMGSSEALGRVGLYPASAGGVGLALLAALPDEKIRATYEFHDEIPMYAGGIEDLLASVNETRERGFAYIQTEEQSHTIAVTIGEPAICAVAISGWVPESAVAEISAALQQVAAEISAKTT